MMKNIYSKITVITLSFILVFGANDIFAGNKDRTGEAGGSQLLINPWARNNGLGGANSARIMGLEAQFLNVAGLAHTNRTELIFAHSDFLSGTQTNIEAFGVAQRLGENKGVLGISVVSINYGEIEITTVDNPEGGIGFFNPRSMNINVSYAKAFSNSIYGGINLKILSESTSNVKAGGVAIDAGIQYVTGKKDQIKFGVALKNVGPNIQFTGDGLTFRGFIPGSENAMTISHRSATLELPSLIRIGASYDIFINDNNTIIPNYTFTSNSFTNDQHAVGLIYNWNDIIILRGGYVIENGMWDIETRTNAYTGIKGGASIQIPANKEGGHFSLDYSYQTSNPFAGTHTIGLSASL